MLKEGRPSRIFSYGLLVNESFECNIKYSQQIQLKVTGCLNWKNRTLCCKKIVFVIPLIITQRKPLTICQQMDRQMDIVNSEFYFHFNFANQYALLWTPNAYRDILMRIFTPCLFFQCVFTNFQCVITLYAPYL